MVAGFWYQKEKEAFVRDFAQRKKINLFAQIFLANNLDVLGTFFVLEAQKGWSEVLSEYVFWHLIFLNRRSEKIIPLVSFSP